VYPGDTILFPLCLPETLLWTTATNLCGLSEHPHHMTSDALELFLTDTKLPHKYFILPHIRKLREKKLC